MGLRSWNKDRAAKRIDAKIDALPLKDIETTSAIPISVILDGRQPQDMDLAQLLKFLPIEWDKQEALFQSDRKRRFQQGIGADQGVHS